MKINKKALISKWFTFEKEGIKAEFEIRPFPLSLFSMSDDMSSGCRQFVYSVTNWNGIEDEDGSPLVCNTENKELLFNYDDDIRDFVFAKLNDIRESIKAELKN